MPPSSDDLRDKLVNEYLHRREQFDHACEQVKEQCSELCERLELKNAWITGRSKEPESLREKLAKKPYKHLSDVPDLAGVRVVVNDRPQVRDFTSVMQEVFKINWRHTTTHRLEIDQVGYASRHFVVEWTSNSKPRAPKLEALNCEIQLRTLLQHAWAQTQRNFPIYKQKHGVSPSRRIRRQLNVISGLLESADSEIEKAWKDNRLIDIKQNSPEPVTARSLADLLNHEVIRNIMRRHGFQEKYFDELRFNDRQMKQAAEDLSRNGTNTILQIVVDLFDFIELLSEALAWPDPIPINNPLQIVMLTSAVADLENRTNMIGHIPSLSTREQDIIKVRLAAQNPGRF
jgi:ppGpp synthetase/RelA/SpoT-type nucleotidyltranferase